MYAINYKNKNELMNTAKYMATTQLNIIAKNTPHLFENPGNGFLRGVNVYDKSDLPQVMANAFIYFFDAHGYFPNMLTPSGYNEKLVWSKFFRKFKVPQSGNKLFTSSFIPESLKHRIQCPDIIWSSEVAKLPSNNKIEPGCYYLKSNHGSGYVKRVNYPLSEKDRESLENICKVWLNKPFNMSTGEWWYNQFPRAIMLERSVADFEHTISWTFYTFGENMPHVSAFKKVQDANQSSWFDGDLNLLPFQSNRPLIPKKEYNIEHVRPLLEIAKNIGKEHSHVRVDFLLDYKGIAYLNEITFTPANARAKRPLLFDKFLGDLWEIDE